MTIKQVLLYLDSEEGAYASWLITDHAGKIEQSVLHSPLTHCLVDKEDSEITVVVPGQDVLLTTAKLPKMNRQRLMQALPFACEEQLIDDLNLLHFAAGEYQSDGTVPVMVVKNQKMVSWLNAVKDLTPSPKIITPSTLALPFDEKNWYAAVFDDNVILRMGKYSGFSSEKNNFTALLQLQLTEIEKKPDCLHIYNFSNEPLSLNLKELMVNEIHEPNKNFLESFKEWMEKYPSLNLLQGNYIAKQKTSFSKKIWRITAGLMAVWILLLFLSNITSLIILGTASNKTEKAIQQIYKRNFPESTSMVSPRERLEAKLKKLSSNLDQNVILTLLDRVGGSLSEANDIRLQNCDFRNHVLNLTVMAKTFDSLDAFTQALTKKGLVVKQQNAGMSGSEVKASLLINKGAL